MSEYHKIQTLYKRDMSNPRKPLIEGAWTLPEFEYLANNVWTFTEKVDGTNIRVIFKDGVVEFGGRTDAAQMPIALAARLDEVFQPLTAEFTALFAGKEVVLYGEGYGAKIQKGGGLYRADQAFVLFDVRVDSFWLQRVDVEDIAQNLGLDIVPVIGTGTLHDAVAWAKAGIQSTWGDFEAEGIVARPKTELCTRRGDRLIAKIKCRDFVV